MERVRIAVLGMNHGFKFASDAARMDGVDLVAVADMTDEGRQRADQLGVPCFDDYQDLLNQCDLDAVIITLPNQLHRAATELCAKRGLNILVEKPIADTIADAYRMVEVCDYFGVNLLVGHHRRFSNRVRQAQEVIAQNQIGRLVGGSLLWVLAKDREYFTAQWRITAGGGPLLINGIHDVDNLRFISGLHISRVFASTRNHIREHVVEDSASVILETREGPTFTYFISDGVPSPWSYEFNMRENPRYVEYAKNCYYFFGTTGSLAFPSMELFSYDSGHYGWEHPLTQRRLETERNDPMTDELLHFVDVVRNGTKPLVSGQDGLETLKVIQAITESGRTGKPVSV